MATDPDDPNALLEEAYRLLLAHAGEDPNRDGLRDTPARAAKAWRELTRGYGVREEDVLATTFDVQHDEMVAVGPIPFTSLCEHHLLPFTGRVWIAYVPGDRIVGLSKLPRLVHEVYAPRLQVQERLTDQLADAIVRVLTPQGVGVRVTARHSCMSARGAKVEAPMTTSALRGVIKHNPAARAEFLDLTRD